MKTWNVCLDEIMQIEVKPIFYSIPQFCVVVKRYWLGERVIKFLNPHPHPQPQNFLPSPLLPTTQIWFSELQFYNWFQFCAYDKILWVEDVLFILVIYAIIL